MTHRYDISDREIIDLYNKGLNYRQISKYFKTESKVIIGRLFKNGIVVEKLSSKKRQDINDNELVELYKNGKSTDEISHILKVSDVTIGNRLKMMGIKLRSIIRNDIKDEDIINLYTNEKLSTGKIAKRYNTTAQLIKTRLQNVGIRRRTKLEAGDLIARKNECVVCRSIFRPRRGWKETTNLKRKTCSDKCYKELMSILTIGKNNPNWKDGSSQTYYQRITRETKPQICEIEGCGNINDVETHHIDRDRTNNSPENTRILCGKHHAMLHYIEDTRGLNGELSGEEKEQLLYKKMIP